jgi:D-alanyl-D-alanine carboxypeptidase
LVKSKIMSAQQQLLEKYGPPDHAYIVKYCSVWNVQADFPWFPIHSFLVNNDFKALLQIAFKALEAKGLHTEIRTYDGCYNDRSVRGSSSTSLHAWAAAIDMDASDNPMISNAETLTPAQRLGKWSQAFVDTMKSAGIFFGGDFHHRADSMHWALLDG